MKLILSVLTVSVTIIGLAACSGKVSDSAKEADKAAQDSKKKTNDSINSLYLGGQPGKITVSGIVVQKQDDKTLLDERLAVNQILGNTYKDNSRNAVSEKNKPILIEAIEPDTSTNSSHTSPASEFVNLGCTNIGASDIEGLTEKKLEASQATLIWATKIFVCGKVILTSAFVNIQAEEMVLNNAEITQKNMVGALNVKTSKIKVEGSNKIETIGMDSIINVMTAPSIDLSISKEINGEGSLLIQSQGGNCIFDKKE
jgi:hypothetical protein